MDNFSVADIQRHMSASAVTVKHQVPFFNIFDIFFYRRLILGAGSPGKIIAEFFENRHYKSGTICTVRETGSPIYIGIPFELKGEVHDLLPVSHPFRLFLPGGFLFRLSADL